MGRILVWRADLAVLKGSLPGEPVWQVWTGLDRSGQGLDRSGQDLDRSAGISSGQLVWQDMSDLCASQIILGIIYPLEMLFLRLSMVMCSMI